MRRGIMLFFSSSHLTAAVAGAAVLLIVWIGYEVRETIRLLREDRDD